MATAVSSPGMRNADGSHVNMGVDYVITYRFSTTGDSDSWRIVDGADVA